jgi:hypothetical protein
MPCYDDFAFDEEQIAKLGQRLRNSKKILVNSEGKCKSLPPRTPTI